MAISKKGLRKIRVDGESYHWKFKKNKDWCPCACNHGTITITIKQSKSDSLLYILIGKEPQPEKTPITPKNIRIFIAYGLQNGWNPNNGPSMTLRFYDFQDLFSTISS